MGCEGRKSGNTSQKWQLRVARLRGDRKTCGRAVHRPGAKAGVATVSSSDVWEGP